MEVIQLLAMFRGTIPKDREKMDLFLRYQAQHFDEKWQDLVESFLTEEGKIEEIPHVYSFHQDIISFLEDSSENNDQDLESYTRNFGQAGLSKLSQLSSWEKYLVQEVAIYNLSTRFYIQSEKEKLEPLSELVFHQNQDVNLVNVYRVANNLSDRISRDIEEFLLMVDSKELKKEVLEIHFEEKEGDVLAYLGSELMATLDTVTDLVQHEENYTQLPLTQKLKIITHFDEVKAIREKSNQVEEVLSPSSDIEQETEETNSFSNVDKIVEEALREYPIGSQVSYKGQVFQLVSIENAQLNDLIRLELLNDSKQLFEENPILYLNSLEEIEQVLSRVELEKEDSEIEIDSSSESQEIDLFSYLEEENEKDKETETLIVGIEETDVPVQDFVFPDDLEDFYPKTNREKIETNIAAIDLVKRLEKEGRQASPEEQELLAKYVGWGGLANEFFDELNPKYETERLTLKSLVSKSEYSTMKQSSLTAYYTDPMIIRQIWQKLLDDGFEGGRILDPSMGTGNFFAAIPRSIREKSELYGVELDSVTGAIAKQLHPNVHIEVRGFEEVPYQNNSFDLVLTNVPFGNFRIADKNYDKPYMIHDYFVKHSLDLVRDGGQVSIISSIGTMDKRTDNVLQEIKTNTHFLGGVRLPDTAFKSIAGTRVTTDLLFFQKDQAKNLNEEELVFSGSIPFEEDKRVWINPYFDGKHNIQVLGQYEVRNFNGGTLNVKGVSETLSTDIMKALENVGAPKQIDNSLKVPVFIQEEVDNSIPSRIREDIALYSFGYEGNQIYYRDTHGIRKSSKVDEISYYVDEKGDFKAWDSSLSEHKIDRFVQLHLTDEEALDVYKSEEASKRGKYKGLFKKTVFYESPLSDKDIGRIKGMVDLRETYQSLIEIQRHQDYSRADFQELLSKLNREYDRFVSQFGYLNASVNRNLFDSDDKYSLLASLEDEYIDSKDQKVKYKKSLAFEKALVRPERVIARVSTALDALNSSLSDGRGVDLDYMVSIYPEHSQAAILDELGDQILMDPESYLRGERKYLSKNQFLSGDILNKIEVVQLLVEENNQEYDWNHALDLLESVRPPRIHLADIEFKIGSRWIPQSVYGKFAFECFTNREFELSSPDVEQVIEVNPVDGQVHLRTSFAYRYPSAKDSSLGVSGSRYDTGRKIFENLLNSNQPTITMTVTEGEKKKTITDLEKTSVLRAKEQHLQELFQEFVSRYSEVQQVIEESYNRLYNRTVSREYDGSHLVIDGLAQNISLRPHQENAIQRIVEEKRALLAHEVGSGKTLTMLGAGFKLKELGMVHKPLYVVPSSLSAQFGQEIMKFFPTKKVFVTTKKDFVKARRKQFVSRIITGDYDAIVIGDSQFEKIPVSKERQMNYIEDKLNELREIKTHSENKYTVKEAEQSISGLERQLEELQRFNRDSFIDFENLGIDFLFVDEAHHFKNIRPITGLGNVAGITNTTSKKNVDMEMKVRQIQEEHDFKNIVFATGTPVSNSISELYTMMNYIQPDILKRYQVDYFDSWVGAFGEIQNSMELAPTGDKYQPKKRFKKFVNLPELMKIYKETADIQTQDMLDLPVPEAHIIPIESELTENQKLYLEELVMRSDMVKCGTVDPSQDNMLKITGEARKLAIDMRLLDSSYSLADNHKLLQVVDNVERIYREGMENKATQIIFSDIGTPKKKDNGFDVYSEIKALLVDRGVPSKEIAFVHDANSDEKKNSLSRKVNAGEVRILLASTEKGGTGLNVQSKMKAVHHLDVPWRPSDIQQRNGRIIRQGNENKEVDIYHYITKGSFDNYLWATQENKLRYIKQIMTSKEPIRAAEDIDEQTMTASDFKALATGNPYLKYKMELENDLTLLENQRRAFQRSKDHYRHTISYCEENMPILEKRLSKYEGDIQQSEMSKDQAFSMTVGKQAFEQRAEAGESLHRLIRHNQADSKEFRTLASYRGFDIKMLSLPTNQPLPETFSVKIVGENQYSVSLDLYSPLGTIQRLQHTIDHIKEDQVKTQNLLEELKDKWTTAKVEIEKNFPKEEDYQTKKAEYDVLAPLIETETDLDIIDQALRQFHEKGNKKQEQLSFELD
ncbi:DEAD/DEAH box helicase family protein [Streptococcus pneumoniae]|nr:SNF2-related protein [Streptococcus pneumoniae]EHZ35553.1 methyltransferase domain protein [Streptococcus pneumoniae GA19101]MDG7997697.1 DEAD/DEAH box helicase family protein [Streptococcus pneumoniae]MDG8275896.1 DEAD/DEAH box helicase family protein [Streptococcus pneumoniae]MDG8289819.1 DEAD/DEAH box helicase family protein [Streptococcus pneumoniae]MDG8303183.1 DEAD/DEAH box helicase family protein [Streptococcus pneumoniae]